MLTDRFTALKIYASSSGFFISRLCWIVDRLAALKVYAASFIFSIFWFCSDDQSDRSWSGNNESGVGGNRSNRNRSNASSASNESNRIVPLLYMRSEKT